MLKRYHTSSNRNGMNSRSTPFRLIRLTAGDLQGPFGRALNPRFVGYFSSFPLSIGGTERFIVVVIRDILNPCGSGLPHRLFGTYSSNKMKILEYARRARPASCGDAPLSARLQQPERTLCTQFPLIASITIKHIICVSCRFISRGGGGGCV